MFARLQWKTFALAVKIHSDKSTKSNKENHLRNSRELVASEVQSDHRFVAFERSIAPPVDSHTRIHEPC